MQAQMLSTRDQQVIKEKLEEVQAILMFLSAEYGVDHLLNVVKPNEARTKMLINETFFNDTVEESSLSMMVDASANLYCAVNQINHLISEGEQVVRCVNDANKPEDIGDFPEANKVYIVDHVIKTKEDVFYALRGLTTNPPYNGFSSKRFIRLGIKPKLN